VTTTNHLEHHSNHPEYPKQPPNNIIATTQNTLATAWQHHSNRPATILNTLATP